MMPEAVSNDGDEDILQEYDLSEADDMAEMDEEDD
jgi:hypothetical protein